MRDNSRFTGDPSPPACCLIYVFHSLRLLNPPRALPRRPRLLQLIDAEQADNKREFQSVARVRAFAFVYGIVITVVTCQSIDDGLAMCRLLEFGRCSLSRVPPADRRVIIVNTER